MERFAIKIDKNLRANLYKICRLCGIDNPDKVKVRDDETIVNLEDGEPELWKKVLDCVGLLITKDDKLPQFMCTLCVDKINDFFEFREMCYATDAQTRKLLGIKEEAKVKIPLQASTSSASCKTEELDIKQPVPVVVPAKSNRKRRNADMEICTGSKDIKADEIDDVKAEIMNTSNSAPKKKRLKLEIQEKDRKASKVSTKTIPVVSRLGLAKKRLKVEPLTKDKKDAKPAKISKILRKNLKVEHPASEIPEEPPLQLQKKKKAFDLLKQRKLAKKVAVVKVEKLRKGSVDAKIKEEELVIVPTSAPTQPKVKLKDKCAICSEAFVNKSLLEKHIKSSHIPTIARYHCVYCNETLKKNMEIKNHNLWHKLSKTPFKCGYCSESSCSIYTYSKHVRDCGQLAYLDTQIPDWHCPECNEIFQTTYLFNIHSCVSNTLVCPGCDRAHKWKEDYFKHIPTCAAAVHRIPSYMSTNIQVKNEAEQPASPIPQHNVQSLPSPTRSTAQPLPASRITPPLMDSNQCVVIPGNVNLLEEGSSPSTKSGSKKGKRITKKDLKRFDKLLKSTMTTLVSIKQEPVQGEHVDEDNIPTLSDVRAESASPAGSLGPADDDFHHNDDDDSPDEETTSIQPVGTIKQEIIDEGYRDLYNNIEVNIKREVVLNRNVETLTSKQKENQQEKECPIPKPVLKLKITKEHGTLNSILLDSPKSEKKKKKKKRKEDKLKAADKSEKDALPEMATNVSTVNIANVAEVPNIEIEPVVGEAQEEEPAMPLPGIVQIKKEITYSDDEGIQETPSFKVSHITPSIVAATSGTLQISCVSEGVHFNGPDENEREEEGYSISNSSEIQEEIDIKPSLEDLVPMLCIASVSSGEDFIKKPTKSNPTRKRRQFKPTTKATASTPQIVSVTSGSEAVSYHLETEEPSNSLEKAFEKVDNNENIFDFSQVKIKEEVVDSTYDDGNDCDMAKEESVNQEDLHNDEEGEETVDEEQDITEKESRKNTTGKQAEENAFIANIDFNNLTIKQEKEYIDDGLENMEGLEYDESSDSDSDSGSDTEDNDSESEREYRDLPSDEEDEFVPTPDPNPSLAPPFGPNPALASLGLQILSVRSEFSSPQIIEKTDSVQGVQPDSPQRIISDPTTDCKRSEATTADKKPVENVDSKLAPESFSSTTVESKAEVEALGFLKANIPIEHGVLTKLENHSNENYSSIAAITDTTKQSSMLMREESYGQVSSQPSPVVTNDSTGNTCGAEAKSIQALNFDYKSSEEIAQSLPQTFNEINESKHVDENLNSPSSLSNLQIISKTISAQEAHIFSSNLELTTTQADQKVLSNKSLSSNVDDNTTREDTPLANTGNTDQISIIEAIGIAPTIAPTNETEAASDRSTHVEDIHILMSAETDRGLDEIASITTADAIAVPTHKAEVILNTLTRVEKVNMLSHDESDRGFNRTPTTEAEAFTMPQYLEDVNTLSPVEAIRSPDRLAPVTAEEAIPGPTHESEAIGNTSNQFNQINIPSPNKIERDLDLDSIVTTTSAVQTADVENNTSVGTANISISSYVDTIIDQTSPAFRDDQIIENIDPIVNDIDRFINRDSSPSLLQERNVLPESEQFLLAFPPRITPSPENQLTSTISQVIKGLSAGNEEPILSSSAQNYASETREPTLVEDAGCHQRPSTSSNPNINQQSVKFSFDSSVNYNSAEPTQQISTEPIQQLVAPNTPDISQSISNDVLLESNSTSSVLLEEGGSQSTVTPIQQQIREIGLSIDLSEVFSNSALPVPVAVLSPKPTNEYTVCSQPSSESTTNTFTCSIDQDHSSSLNYMNANLAELCRRTSTSQPERTEFQLDLNLPTAGQLHTLLIPTVIDPNTTSASPIPNAVNLNEEVQNLLNEGTDASNTFELNNSILQARCSMSANLYTPPSPPAVSAPNFTDLQNVNEIAENNNNANIERELQDELGNVLAAAIADRVQTNDEADNENLINENRANFDTT